MTADSHVVWKFSSVYSNVLLSPVNRMLYMTVFWMTLAGRFELDNHWLLMFNIQVK